MCLHVGLDVFLAPEALVAGGEETEVLLVSGGGAGDVTGDVVGGDAGFSVGFVGMYSIFRQGTVVRRGLHGCVGLAGEFIYRGIIDWALRCGLLSNGSR